MVRWNSGPLTPGNGKAVTGSSDPSSTAATGSLPVKSIVLEQVGFVDVVALSKKTIYCAGVAIYRSPRLDTCWGSLSRRSRLSVNSSNLLLYTIDTHQSLYPPRPLRSSEVGLLAQEFRPLQGLVRPRLTGCSQSSAGADAAGCLRGEVGASDWRTTGRCVFRRGRQACRTPSPIRRHPAGRRELRYGSSPSSCGHPTSSSSTRVSVVMGWPRAMTSMSEGADALPFASDTDSVYTRRWLSTTSRYLPVNHICIRPSGVCISLHTRRVPPVRTSIFATGMVAPTGRYQALKCSGSVHICQMRSPGASKLRSITTAGSLAASSWPMPRRSRLGAGCGRTRRVPV
jgi:hypothetical protein